jgi:hypothetical protein
MEVVFEFIPRKQQCHEIKKKEAPHRDTHFASHQDHLDILDSAIAPQNNV